MTATVAPMYSSIADRRASCKNQRQFFGSTRYSLQKSLRFFVRIVGGAILQFTLGFVPEFIIPAFGLASKLPQLMGTCSDLIIARIGHV